MSTSSASLQPLDSSAPWTRREARHLLNRAGFGIPLDAVDKLTKLGPAGAVDLMVEYERFPDNLQEPTFLVAADPGEMMNGPRNETDPAARQRKVLEMLRDQRMQVEQLKTWWLDQMRGTSRPLQEKMTLFWHGHFATSAEKVKQADANYEINSIFRAGATGNLKALVTEVSKSSAMLRYLDNDKNRKGQPNENWARELMELFTMGIGTYTEEDIKESARAFSGYTDRGGVFKKIANQHDNGTKTFLGKTGNFDGADIIRIIFEQPVTARFIAKKLWEFFVYENPSPETVEGLAAVLRANNYELKPLLRALFLSREFYGEKAMAGQIKSPTQYTVMLMEQLNYTPERKQLINLTMKALGQELFLPPNVKGWPGNRAWINTYTLMMRLNIPAYVLLGEMPALNPEMRLDETEKDANAAMTTAAGTPATNARNRGATGNRPALAERGARARELMGQRRRAQAEKELATLFAKWEGRPAGEVVDGLADELLGRSLTPAQRSTLVGSLVGSSKSTAPFRYTSATGEAAVKTTHLILCMAEYQLC